MSLNKTFAEYLQWQSKEKMNSSAQAAIADNAIDPDTIMVNGHKTRIFF